MMMPRRVATVFGGAGFIGRRIVRRLANRGYTVRVALRYPHQALSLKPMGNVGQIIPVPVDFTNQDAVTAVMDGVDAVINTVGTLYEYGQNRTFQAAHVEGPARVAMAARDLGLPCFIHISALGASDRSASAYMRSKAQGEELVMRAFPQATILRPSVVFGPDDRFFNRFASIGRFTGFLPVIDKEALSLTLKNGIPTFICMGKGGPMFQPIYVEDIANVVTKALDDGKYAGQIFELGGPSRYSMKEIMELIMLYSHRKYRLMPIPTFWAKVHARYLQWFPNPILTLDQVKMLQSDNVVTGSKPDITAFGVPPTPAEVVLPTYLARFRDAEERQIAQAFR